MSKATSEAGASPIQGVHPLPPLILHPFTESASTVRVLESAKASISMLRESDQSDEKNQELERQMLDGRFTEFRMLFYVGKDVCRWLEQCVDTCDRESELQGAGLGQQAFARLLIEDTPPDVAEKLKSWGVIEYSRIFSRSIGIYNQFRLPPTAEMLQTSYLRYYYRFADFAFAAWKDLKKGPAISREQFPFTLYASGEYTKMLEEEWRETTS